MFGHQYFYENAVLQAIQDDNLQKLKCGLDLLNDEAPHSFLDKKFKKKYLIHALKISVKKKYKSKYKSNCAPYLLSLFPIDHLNEDGLDELKELFSKSLENVLSLAIEGNEIDIVKELLALAKIYETKSKVKYWLDSDSKGNLPLHYACENASTDIAEILLDLIRGELEYLSLINRFNNEGETPLHFVAIDNTLMLELMLTSGANINLSCHQAIIPFTLEILADNTLNHLMQRGALLRFREETEKEAVKNKITALNPRDELSKFNKQERQILAKNCKRILYFFPNNEEIKSVYFRILHLDASLTELAMATIVLRHGTAIQPQLFSEDLLERFANYKHITHDVSLVQSDQKTSINVIELLNEDMQFLIAMNAEIEELGLRLKKQEERGLEILTRIIKMIVIFIAISLLALLMGGPVFIWNSIPETHVENGRKISKPVDFIFISSMFLLGLIFIGGVSLIAAVVLSFELANCYVKQWKLLEPKDWKSIGENLNLLLTIIKELKSHQKKDTKALKAHQEASTSEANTVSYINLPRATIHSLGRIAVELSHRLSYEEAQKVLKELSGHIKDVKVSINYHQTPLSRFSLLRTELPQEQEFDLEDGYALVPVTHVRQ